MNVGANLLSRLGCTEDPDDGYLRRDLLLRLPIRFLWLWIELGGGSLVVVDAVQSDAEEFHRSNKCRKPTKLGETRIMMSYKFQM